ALTTLGMPRVRVFRSVATLLTLTLNLVMVSPRQCLSRVQRQPADQGQGRGLDAQDAWPEIDDRPARRLRLANLLLRKAAFRADRHSHVAAVAPQRFAARMRQQSASLALRVDDVVPVGRRLDAHQHIAAALLRRLDDVPLQLLQAGLARLDDTPLG